MYFILCCNRSSEEDIVEPAPIKKELKKVLFRYNF